MSYTLPDGTPNWELYPDATHYCPETDDTFESFLKKGDEDSLWFVSKSAGFEAWTEDDFGDGFDLDDGSFIVKA